MDIKIKIKKFIKKFVDYTIIDDNKTYTLRHTNLSVKCSLTKKFEKVYGNLPIEPKKIVVDNYMGQGYGCNCKYVTEALLASGQDYDIVWIVKNVDARRTQFPEGVRLVEYLSPDAMREYATARIWLCNYHLIAYFNRGLSKKPSQTYIQMWHGSFGIKKIENDCGILTDNKAWKYLAEKNSRNTDYWISNSAFETGIYRRAFWDVKEIKELGHPRNDIFFREDEDQITEHVKKQLGIEQKQNIVLYVPTLREINEFPKDVLDVDMLSKVLEERTGHSWCVVVRLHPRMRGKLENVCTGSADRIYHADDYPDIQELLSAAQVVITDYSSCIFDFLLSGKPGFIYAPDIEAYNNERGFYYKLEDTPFPIATDNDGLCENIKMFDDKVYHEKLERFLKDKESVEDGKASERVASLIEDILSEKEY